MICPFCKEEIKEGAQKCKFCKSFLSDISQNIGSLTTQNKNVEESIKKSIRIENAHEIFNKGDIKNAYNELKSAGNIKSLLASSPNIYFWVFELIMSLEKEEIEDIQIKKFSNENFPIEWQNNINAYFSKKSKQQLIIHFRNQLEVAKKRNVLSDELESINHLISLGEKEYLNRKYEIEELLDKKKKKRHIYIGAFIAILIGIPLVNHIANNIHRELLNRAYDKQKIAYKKAINIGTIESFNEFLNNKLNDDREFREILQYELRRLYWEKEVGQKNVLYWRNLIKQAHRELDNTNVKAAQSLLKTAQSIRDSKEIEILSARLEPFLRMEKIITSGSGSLSFLLAISDNKIAYSELYLADGDLVYYVYSGGSTSDKFVVALMAIDLISMQSDRGNLVSVKTRIANKVKFFQLEEFSGPRVFYEGRRDSFVINTKGLDEAAILRKILISIIQPNSLH